MKELIAGAMALGIYPVSFDLMRQFPSIHPEGCREVFLH